MAAGQLYGLDVWVAVVGRLSSRLWESYKAPVASNGLGTLLHLYDAAYGHLYRKKRHYLTFESPSKTLKRILAIK